MLVLQLCLGILENMQHCSHIPVKLLMLCSNNKSNAFGNADLRTTVYIKHCEINYSNHFYLAPAFLVNVVSAQTTVTF